MGNCVIRITTLNPEQQKKKCDTLSVFASWEGESDKNREKGHSHKLLFFFLKSDTQYKGNAEFKIDWGGGGVLFSRLYSNLQGKEKNLCKEIMSSKDVNFP